MNAAELASLNMFGCPRCHCVFPREGYYTKGGKKDSYCKGCRRSINMPRDEDRQRVTYHHRDSIAIPTATRRCVCCGIVYANFAVFFPTQADACCFCGGGK